MFNKALATLCAGLLLYATGAEAQTYYPPPPASGGGSGTVTSVVCPSATITSSGTCAPLAAAGTSGDVITASGTNQIGDSGTLLSSLAPLASPTFTGTPAAPTPSTADNSTKIATTAYVQANLGAFSGCTVSGSSTQLVIVNSGGTGCVVSTATLTAAGIFLDASPTANNYAFSVTGGSVTSGTTGMGFNVAGTVNDASAVDGIAYFANVTCTLCTATSYLMDLQVAGSSKFRVDTTGAVTTANSLNIGAGNLTLPNVSNMSWAARGILTSPAAGAVQFGNTDAATAVAQTISLQNATTAGNAGANALFNLSGGATTGAGGDLTFQGTPTGTIGRTAAETISHLGVVKLSPGFIVSTLPASPPTGSRAYVTDQLTACVAAGATLVGGGGVTCPTFYNGSAWVGD